MTTDMPRIPPLVERRRNSGREASEAIDWERPGTGWSRCEPAPSSDGSRAPGSILLECVFDTCHVAAGRGERTALIMDSPVPAIYGSTTYRELRDEVARLAGVLTSLGV